MLTIRTGGLSSLKKTVSSIPLLAYMRNSANFKNKGKGRPRRKESGEKQKVRGGGGPGKEPEESSARAEWVDLAPSI